LNASGNHSLARIYSVTLSLPCFICVT
jgi:hypothetical protein